MKANSVVRGQIWAKFELVQALMDSLIVSKGLDQKQPRNSADTIFPIKSL